MGAIRKRSACKHPERLRPRRRRASLDRSFLELGPDLYHWLVDGLMLFGLFAIMSLGLQYPCLPVVVRNERGEDRRQSGRRI
jgi:hypothetical protein